MLSSNITFDHENLGYSNRHKVFLLSDTRLAGSVTLSVSDIEVYIEDLHVSAGFRRCGYGKALLRYLNTWELTAGKSQMLLVYHDNEVAIRLYENEGFQKTSDIPQSDHVDRPMIGMTKAVDNC